MQEGATQEYRGKFKAGFDPRRHRFTREECQRGYLAAEESLERRFPGQGHFLLCAIVGSMPWYRLPEIRRLLDRDEPATEQEIINALQRKDTTS